MSEDRFYINGSMVSEDQAMISAKDRGFMYGDGVFETMRAYSGRIFRLEQHIERLLDGLRVLRFAGIPDAAELIYAVRKTVDENNWQDARVKLVVTRGTSSSLAPEDVPPTVVVTGSPFAATPSRLPLSAAIVGIRRDESSPLARVKSLNYLPSAVGLIEAREKGADEGVLLNRYGKVAEGTTTNLFLVLEGKLITPSIESGALPGITRDVVLDVAGSSGTDVEERAVEREELFQAEEVFATNSVIEIRAIASIDSRPVGSGRIGSLTQRIAEAYSRLVRSELGID